MHTPPIVYLAGPITGQTYAECVDWREEAEKLLFEQGMRGISPMRGKEYLKNETSVADEYAQKVSSTQKAITTRDRFDVMRCDAVLVNFTKELQISIGTCIELGWADAFRKPVMLITDSSTKHDHSMVREIAGWTVPTLEIAVDVLASILVA